MQGVDVIAATLRKLALSCRTELMAAQPGGPRGPALLPSSRPRVMDAVGRGVRYRTLYQHAVRTHGPTLDFMEQLQTAGGEFRTLGELFNRMIIYDRSVALIADHRYVRMGNALLVEHPGIVGLLE